MTTVSSCRPLLGVVALVLSLCGCSTVHTHKGEFPLSSIQEAERFQLRVRSGNTVIDDLLYEMAYQQFSEVLPLREKEPYTGTLEITFASSDQSWFVSGSSSVANSSVGWYTRAGYIGGALAGSSSTISSGGTITWQNSTMIIVLKKSDGERLWSADYNYKGGYEMSGWVVNTPEEAARLLVKRLKERFESDFARR